tara:strand:+ start:397 stop:558 length:162 start_codon:yes stop_codon:yes gene_type:complete
MTPSAERYSSALLTNTYIMNTIKKIALSDIIIITFALFVVLTGSALMAHELNF